MSNSGLKYHVKGFTILEKVDIGRNINIQFIEMNNNILYCKYLQLYFHFIFY